MEPAQEPVKDPDREHPVAVGWQHVFRAIVARIATGDHRLEGIEGVTPLSREEGRVKLAEPIEAYGDATVVELPDATWATSVALWTGLTSWDVLIDLYTAEEGRSDLVLQARVSEVDDGYRFDIHMIYVP